MAAENCWELKKCGREPGGSKVAELGVCPAATENKLHNVNNGKNGGRSCWVIAGTFCGGKVQGSFAQKLANCMDCFFYKQVQTEEKGELKSSSEILKILKS